MLHSGSACHLAYSSDDVGVSDAISHKWTTRCFPSVSHFSAVSRRPFVSRCSAIISAVFCLLALFSSGATPTFAQELTGSFQLWMLNNEARVMTILAADRTILDRMAAPLGMLPALSLPAQHPEEKLWKTNLTLYNVLPELNEIFDLARRFGSGRFAKLLESVRPGKWITAPCMGIPTIHARRIATVVDKAFQDTFLAANGINKGKDLDLAGRFGSALNKISDTDKRIMDAFLGHFTALYPGNVPTRRLSSLFQNGIKKELTKGLAGLAGGEGEGTPVASSASLSSTSSTPASASASEVAAKPITDDVGAIFGDASGTPASESLGVTTNEASNENANAAAASEPSASPVGQRGDYDNPDPFNIMDPGK